LPENQSIARGEFTGGLLAATRACTASSTPIGNAHLCTKSHTSIAAIVLYSASYGSSVK
jgi:hypothetical protein